MLVKLMRSVERTGGEEQARAIRGPVRHGVAEQYEPITPAQLDGREPRGEALPRLVRIGGVIDDLAAHTQEDHREGREEEWRGSRR